MAFKDLTEFLDPDLRLPWNGKTYVIPAVSADVGLRCQALASVAGSVFVSQETGEQATISDRDKEILSDAAERDLFRDVLGPAFDELVADKASWPVIKHMAMTAFTYFAVGEEEAMAAWEGPKAPSREVRRAAARTGTAGANGTRRRASTNGTSSRRAKSPASASRSPGGPSSPTGT